MLDGTTSTIDEPAEGQCTLTLSCVGSAEASTTAAVGAVADCPGGELGIGGIDGMAGVPERPPVNEPGVSGRSAESMEAGVMERISGCAGLIVRSKLCIVFALDMGGGCCCGTAEGYAEVKPRDGNLCADGLAVAARTGRF